MENEKRKFPRVEVNWPLTIYFEDGEIEGETMNISAEGLFIHTENPLPLKKNFRISINPPDHQAIGLNGEVIRSDLYGIDGSGESDVYGLGICLVDLSEEDKRIIRDMLSNYL